MILNILLTIRKHKNSGKDDISCQGRDEKKSKDAAKILGCLGSVEMQRMLWRSRGFQKCLQALGICGIKTWNLVKRGAGNRKREILQTHGMVEMESIKTLSLL